MKIKLIIAATTIFIIIVSVSSYQPINAATYTGHDGSVDKYLTKVKISKVKGNLWAYIVKACATDYTMGIAEVILKSDMEQVRLGVNKNLGKGSCSYYGAVMNAKDSKTLGAELVETHEAVDKVLSLQKSLSSLPKSQLNDAMKEILYYRTLLNNLF